jgi:tetratricopeptide (TPR) repeat protein
MLFDLQAEIIHRQGNVASSRNNLVQAIEKFEQSLELFEKLNNLHRVRTVFNNLATVYGRKGDLNQSMEYYKKSYTLSLKLGSNRGCAFASSGFAEVHVDRGELNEALKSLLQAQRYAEKSQSPITLHIPNLGGVYWRLGELDRAREILEQGLQIQMKHSLTVRYVLAFHLYTLVKVTIDQEDLEAANRYVERLQAFHEEEPTHLIRSQFYRVAKALTLKISPRLRDRVQAEELLIQVVNEAASDHTLMNEAMLHLCDLRLVELRLTGNPAVLKEIQELLDQLRTNAQAMASYWLLAETYVLQARLALMELNLTEVRNLLTQAQIVAEEQQMGRLSQGIAQEYDILMERLERWEEFVAQKASLQDRADILQLEALVTRMIYVRHTDLEDPVIRAHIIAPESFAVNEEIRLAIDLINIGRKPGLALRIEKLLPKRFTLLETQPEYATEGGSLILGGTLLGPMQTISLSLNVRVEGYDSIELSPQIVYANLQGDFEISHVKSIQLTPLLIFESVKSQIMFEYLVEAFRTDTLGKGLSVDEAGWRTRTQVLDRVPQVHTRDLYRSGGQFGRLLQELHDHSMVEVRLEAGKRGRGGHRMKIRVAHDKEAVKQYIDKK